MRRRLLLAMVSLAAAVPLYAYAVSTSKNLDVTVCPGSSCGVTVSVNNSTPHAGDTITITYNPGSNTTAATDTLQLNYVPPEHTCNVPPGTDGNDAQPLSVPVPNATPGNHTATLRIPMVPSDVPQYYQVEYWQNAPTGVNPCQGGSLLYVAAASGTITVPPTLPAPSYPAAPSYLTYPPPGWPASPNETVTVCASGCQFSNLDDASFYINWQDANRDWIKVDVQSGTYYSPIRYGAWGQYGNCGSMPGGRCAEHVWIYGHGPTRPFISCASTQTLPCVSVIGATAVHTVIDNIEVGYTIKSGANSPAVSPLACASQDYFHDRDSTLWRNVYIHDGGNGGLGIGLCPFDITFQNSHIARFGGPVGPSHDMYINDFAPNGSGYPAVIWDGHLVVDHSVFELAEIGHTLKSHANRVDINCSQIVNGAAEIFSGSQAIDLDGGGGQVTVNDSLIVAGQYYYNSQANSPWFVEFGGDKSGWSGDQPTQFLSFNRSYIINDRGQFMIGLAAPMQPNQPYASSNNVFIGPWDDGFTGSSCNGSIPCLTPASTFSSTGGRISDMNFGCAGGNCRPLLDSGTASSTGNLFFSSRAQARAHSWPSAGSPIQDAVQRTDQGGTSYSAWPFDSTRYPMPPACTDPVGNVLWPN